MNWRQAGPAPRRTRRGLLYLAAPFIVLPLLARLAVGPLGDSLAAAAAGVAPRQAAPDEANIDEPALLGEKASGQARYSPRRVASAGRMLRGSSDGGAPWLAADAGARGTIVVPASVVAKAITDRIVGARDAVDDDGKPLGARIHGVNRYGTGLRNGDIIVSVAGTRTPTTAALVEVGMHAIAAGATRLSGRILRDGALWDVVLELPPKPVTEP